MDLFEIEVPKYYLAQEDPDHNREDWTTPNTWQRLKAKSLRDAAIKYLGRNPTMLRVYSPMVWLIVVEDKPGNKHPSGVPKYMDAFLLEG